MKNKIIWRIRALAFSRLGHLDPLLVWAVGFADGLITAVGIVAIGYWLVQR